MEKQKKKQFVLGSLGVFLLVGIIAVTWAYLTDKHTANNIVTIGNVNVLLVEPSFPRDETPVFTPYKLIAKDPKMVNTGTNDAFVFMKLTVPVENSIRIGNDRKRESTAKTKQEIFTLAPLGTYSGKTVTLSDSTAVDTISYNAEWEFLYHDYTSNENTHTYYFGYTKKLNIGQSTVPLFDTVTLTSILEYDENRDLAEAITVEGYAIQTDNIMADDIDTTTLDRENLTKILTIINNQRE